MAAIQEHLLKRLIYP